MMNDTKVRALDKQSAVARVSTPPVLTGWGDYFAVAASQRFRASQRRRVFDAARLAMLIVAAVAFLDCATLTIVHPHAARTLVVLNVG
ncbi:MAG TPA: hypothetical protein VEY67_08905, partial [Candidatus Dormibacteraeota bacterium]|nr:hypothetical protein [Candidatus Dormibacteraeota bacterium]